VLGPSDGQAGKPATEKYAPKHLLTTFMHARFDIGKVRVSREVPKKAVNTIWTVSTWHPPRILPPQNATNGKL
jgi:hypothetical protein